MGIFSSIFKGKKQKEEKQKEINKEENNSDNKKTENSINKQILSFGHHLKIHDSDDEAYMYNIRQINEIVHSDGRRCNLFSAQILVHRENDAVMFDMGDNICFELAENIPIDDKLLDHVAAFYLFSKDPNKDRYYLGEIEEDKEGKYDYKIGKKSEAVENIYNKFLDKEEAQRSQMRQEQEAQRKANDFRAMLRVKNEVQKQNEIQAQIDSKKRAERVGNYYLKQTGGRYLDNGRYLYNYDGINLSEGEDRGKILKIRDLETIGSDGSGTRLYSGYICNANEESSREYVDHREMTPVCFELYRSLNDIIRGGNSEEIKNILTFLSREFEQSNGLNYIGHLNQTVNYNQYGEIVRNTTIEKEPSSQTMAMQIRKLQERFLQRNNDDYIK